MLPAAARSSPSRAHAPPCDVGWTPVWLPRHTPRLCRSTHAPSLPPLLQFLHPHTGTLEYAHVRFLCRTARKLGTRTSLVPCHRPAGGRRQNCATSATWCPLRSPLPWIFGRIRLLGTLRPHWPFRGGAIRRPLALPPPGPTQSEGRAGSPLRTCPANQHRACAGDPSTEMIDEVLEIHQRRRSRAARLLRCIRCRQASYRLQSTRATKRIPVLT